MNKLFPILIGLMVIGIVGGLIFWVADQWGAETYHGNAIVLNHDYNAAYTTYDSNTKMSTFHPEQFILIIQYEDIITSDHVREYLWDAVADGDKVAIDYWYGYFSGAFYVNITGESNN